MLEHLYSNVVMSLKMAATEAISNSTSPSHYYPGGIWLWLKRIVLPFQKCLLLL